jgi:hypothetical protein
MFDNVKDGMYLQDDTSDYGSDVSELFEGAKEKQLEPPMIKKGKIENESGKN